MMGPRQIGGLIPNQAAYLSHTAGARARGVEAKHGWGVSDSQWPTIVSMGLQTQRIGNGGPADHHARR